MVLPATTFPVRINTDSFDPRTFFSQKLLYKIMSTTFKMLAIALLFASCTPTPEICLTNGTNYDIVFSANDGGRYRQVGTNYCTEQDAGNFSWIADYPTKDNSSDLFASWSGSFETGSKDFKFVFTEVSGTQDFDFRDAKIGSYNFLCQTLTMMGSDTINIQQETITGTLSKSNTLTQLAVKITAFYDGEIAFSNDVYNFVGIGGGFGQISPVHQFGFSIDQSGAGGATIKKSCVGTKM